jgi:hypothetical protein
MEVEAANTLTLVIVRLVEEEAVLSILVLKLYGAHMHRRQYYRL